jgi:creatinine amidohydrolase
VRERQRDIGDAPRPLRLSELSTLAISRAVERGAAIALVVGSMEQHGPHLPLGTDLLIPVALAELLSQNLDLVMAPPIPYGCRSMPQVGAGEFFPGTLSIDGGILGRFIESVISQLVATGFRKILLFSWHWENMRVVWESGMRAFEAYEGEGLKLVVQDNPGRLITPDTIAAVFGADFAGWELEHASIAETSLMQWLYPELVQSELIMDDMPREVVPYDVIPAVRARAPRSGVFGPATRASATSGELLARDLSEGLSGIVQRELGVSVRHETMPRNSDGIGAPSAGQSGHGGGNATTRRVKR